MWAATVSIPTKLGLTTWHLRQKVEQFLSFFRRRRYTTFAQATAPEQATAFTRVRDVGDVLWDIHEARATKYGFSLYFGRPADKDVACHGGRPRLIVTKALEDYWWGIQTTGRRGDIYDLPAAISVLKRARLRLGLNYYDDVKAFWTGRIEDLESLPLREFAAKYGVNRTTADFWRMKLLGRRARPIGWWRTPEVREILLSGKPLSQIGCELEISALHAKELRRRAKQEAR